MPWTRLCTLILALVFTNGVGAQQGAGDDSGSDQAETATPQTQEADDPRSETRRRVEKETAEWVEKILDDQSRRDSQR